MAGPRLEPFTVPTEPRRLMWCPTKHARAPELAAGATRFSHTPLCLLGLAAQRAHEDPEVLRIDGARPIPVEQVERVLDLVELVLLELLLSSVELALRSLLGLRTSARAWSAAGATTRGVRSHAHLALLVVLRFACHGAVHDGARSFRNVDSVWHACACMPYAHTYA